ncbi:OprB family porin [Nitrospirillum viridazoti]|uniref:Carbohydrate porin n=1 Tax=Nitrospirillum viridazoti CBAmc TaxID=1441467 RepID=A0A248JUI1_9PROT|nr:carbohydrate porin [Nitrospirillum amazonense CBAmc]TWB43086.1 OprB family porin [Nitrospirillum amazonense]
MRPYFLPRITGLLVTAGLFMHATAGAAETPGAPALGDRLANAGLSLTLDYTGEAAANPSGGLRQGSAYAGQLHAGADADLERILGLDGTVLHAALTQRHGRNLAADAIGNNTSVQEVYGLQNLHLLTLTLEKKLLDGRVDMEVGRMVANAAFLNNPLYCHFQTNAICGNPVFVNHVSNYTSAPGSSWAGRVKADLTDTLYAHVGAYEANPRDQSPTGHGLHFGTDGATGVVVPFELGYAPGDRASSLPGHYQVGGWYDSSTYSDPLNDAMGRPSVLTGRPGMTEAGRWGASGRFDQVVWRSASNPARTLSVFGVAMASVSGRAVEDRYFALGVVQTGLVEGRDQDTLGLVITDQRFSDLTLARIAAARASVSSTVSAARHEVMMELAYGMQVTSGVRVSPNLQYIVNPDVTARPFTRDNPADAFVVGLKFTVDIAHILRGVSL